MRRDAAKEWLLSVLLELVEEDPMIITVSGHEFAREFLEKLEAAGYESAADALAEEMGDGEHDEARPEGQAPPAEAVR